ncbi:MAG: hypothetical protein IJI57_00950 [Flexilinea sp.]|nr:hypothetical protein [Flexilinea sp.]
MKKIFLQFLKDIPLIILCIFLAFFIWIFATMTSDPTEEGRFSQTITIETVGLPENCMITSGLPSSVSVNLRAPNSVWRRISMERVQGKAIIDVTGLEPGTHQIPVSVQIGISPVQIISVTPSVATVTIEEFETREFPIVVEETGEIPTAFRADAPVLSQETVEISGTVTQLDKISKVSVLLERNNNTETIEDTLPIYAYTEEGRIVKDVTITPDKVKVTEEIRMRGGYRILSVKLSVKGEISAGYRVDNLGVDPGFVTVYSADKELLNSLNSFIETETIMLDEITATTNRKVSLNVPEGITLVGDTTVTVNITVSAVEGTQTFSQIPISAVGIDEGLEAYISPSDIDVYLAGPLISLSEVEPADIHAILDLKDLGEGNYQLVPVVEVASNDPITVNSVQPQTIDVQITVIPGEEIDSESESIPADEEPDGNA